MPESMIEPLGTPVAVDPCAVDVFEFARNGWRAAGEMRIADLPRMLTEVPADAPERDTVLRWQLQGEMRSEMEVQGVEEAPYLRLALLGNVWLECQRCLGPYRQAIDVTVRYRIAASEEEADAYPLDDDDVDVIVGSHNFDLRDLIDEELLLSLPLVPKHEACPEVHDSLVSGATDGKSEREDAAELKPPHPFAALEVLKAPVPGPDGDN